MFLKKYGLRLLCFRFEFFLDLLDIHVLDNGLEVLALKRLPSSSRFRLVLTVLSLKSCY